MKVSAEKLRTARRNAKLSQEAFAEALTKKLGRTPPIHFTTVSRWENGHNQPDDIGTVVAVAGVLGIGDFRELLEADASDDEEEDSALYAPLYRAVQAAVRAEVRRALRDEVAA